MAAASLADLYHLPLLDWARSEARLEAGLARTPARAGTWPATRAEHRGPSAVATTEPGGATRWQF
jgi:hypothetical protein